jgi:hypothetical protein
MKSILLARPHPFIVADVAPLLAAKGFEPIRLESLACVESAGTATWHDAIISLAISSSIDATATKVVRALHAKAPQLSPALPRMIPMEVRVQTIRRLLDDHPPGVVDVDVDVDSQYLQPRPLGNIDTCLNFNKVRISVHTLRASIQSMIAAHFR